MPKFPVVGSSRPSSGRIGPRRLFEGGRSSSSSNNNSSSSSSSNGGGRLRGGKWLPMILAFFGGAAVMSIVMATLKVVTMHGASLPSHPATPASYWLQPVVKELHAYPIKFIAATSLPHRVSSEFLWSSPRITSASCGAESCHRRRGNNNPGKCRQHGKEAALVLIRHTHANHSRSVPVDSGDTSSRSGSNDGGDDSRSGSRSGGGRGRGGRRVVDVYVPWALRHPPCTVTVRYLTGGSGRGTSVLATLASATSEGGHVRFHAAHLGIYAIYYRGFYTCGKNCWMDDCPPSRRRRTNQQLSSTRGGDESHDDGGGYAGLSHDALAAAANRNGSSPTTTSKRGSAVTALATATTSTDVATRLLGFAAASNFDRREPFEFLASHAQQQKLLHTVMRARQHAAPLTSRPTSFAADALLFALPLINIRRDALRCHLGRLPWSVVAYYTDWKSSVVAGSTSLPYNRGEGGARWSRGASAVANGGGDAMAADLERDQIVHPLLRPHVSIGPVRSGRAAAFQLVVWRHGLKTIMRRMRIRREQQEQERVAKLELEGVEQEEEQELEALPPLLPPLPSSPPPPRKGYYKVTIGPCEVDDSDAAVAGLQLPWMCIRGGRTTACNEPSRVFDSREESGSGALSAILVTLQVPSWDWLVWRGVPATAEEVQCRAAGQVSIDDELVIPFTVDLNIEKWQPRTKTAWLSSYCGSAMENSNKKGEMSSDDDAMRLSWLTSCPYCGDDSLVAGLTPIQRVGVAPDSAEAAAATAAAMAAAAPAVVAPWDLDLKSRVSSDIVETASISATPRSRLSYDEHLLTVLGRRIGVAMPSIHPNAAAAGMGSLPLFSRLTGPSDDSNVLAAPPSESQSSQAQGPFMDAPASFRVLDASGAPLRWVGTNQHFRRDPSSNRDSNDDGHGAGDAARGEAWSWQYQARSVAPSMSSTSDAEQPLRPPPTTSLLASVSASLGLDGVIEGTLELRVVGQAAPVAAVAEAEAGPLRNAAIGDVQLRACLSAAAVPFAAGAGMQGGFRPVHGTDWRWRPSMAENTQKGYAPGMGDSDATWDNMLWVGSQTSGLKLTLLPSSPDDDNDNGDVDNNDDDDDDDGKHTTQPAQLAWKVPRRDWPDSWHNNGRGGIRLTSASPSSSSQDDATVDLVAYSGERALPLDGHGKRGIILRFHWRAVVTPVRPFDASRLFGPAMRRFHVTGRQWTPPPLQELMGESEGNDRGGDGSASSSAGETEEGRGSSGAVAALTLHHGTLLNPYINYPFHSLTIARLRNLSTSIRNAQQRQGVENDGATAGLSIYYTLRELSNHATELPLLPALGASVLVEQRKQSRSVLPNRQFHQQQQQPLLSRPGSVWLSEHLGFRQEAENEEAEEEAADRVHFEGTLDGGALTAGGALYTPAWTTSLARARGGELLPDSESDPGVAAADSRGGKPATSRSRSGSGGSGAVDNAVSVHGVGPWVNHFVQGARWLSSCGGVGGFYLDSVAFDRRAMRRFRRAAEQGCEASLVAEMPGSSSSSSSSSSQTPPRGHCGGARGTVPHVDLHCNNKTVVYLEYLPYVDSLWVGELLDFFREGKRKAHREKTKGGGQSSSSTVHSTQHLTQPDYFLVAASGIPFGVPSQLLSGSLSPYGRRPDLYFKALLFGMTDRAGWAGTGGGSAAKSSHVPPHLPALWRLWDDLGFSTAQSVVMHGWWTKRRLVRVELDAKDAPLEGGVSSDASASASASAGIPTRDRFLATAFVRCAAESPPTNKDGATEATPKKPPGECRAAAALIVVADWPRPTDGMNQADSSSAFDLFVDVDLQGLGFGDALEETTAVAREDNSSGLEESIVISAPNIPTLQPDPPKVTLKRTSRVLKNVDEATESIIGDLSGELRGRTLIRVEGVAPRSSGALIVLRSPGGGRRPQQ